MLSARRAVFLTRPAASIAPLRAFTTTQSSQAIKIPPESPRYINLPIQPQMEVEKKPLNRGHLPVPKDVFHPTQGRKKLASSYLEKTAPRSASEKRGEEPRSEHEGWRRVMAESRRQNLSAGLKGLWQRRTAKKRGERTRARRHFEDNRQAALFTPEREEEVLMRSTVRDHTAKDTAVQRDPERFQRAAESADRTAAISEFKRECRRDALMELYVASANFIVDEAELEATVEKLFTKDYFHKLGTPTGNLYPENIWESRGMPHTVFSLLGSHIRSGKQLTDAFLPEAERTANRQKTLSEALTGGKIPA